MINNVNDLQKTELDEKIDYKYLSTYISVYGGAREEE